MHVSSRLAQGYTHLTTRGEVMKLLVAILEAIQRVMNNKEIYFRHHATNRRKLGVGNSNVTSGN